MSQEVKRFMIGTVRWVARILALLVSGPFIYFLLFKSGEVVPELSWSAPNQMPLFVAWLAVVVGILMSWRWEMAGGLLTAASAILIGVFGYLGCGSGELLTCLIVAGPYLLSGLLLLGCCWGKDQLDAGEANVEAAA
jgi:hypothetical protein